MRCIVCDRETIFQMRRKEMVVSLCYEHVENEFLSSASMGRKWMALP